MINVFQDFVYVKLTTAGEMLQFKNTSMTIFKPSQIIYAWEQIFSSVIGEESSCGNRNADQVILKVSKI